MQRLRALIIKEFLQIIRDPSSILIAFVLPLILLFVFGYGVNLDSNRIKVGLVLEEYTPVTNSLAMSFVRSPFFQVSVKTDRNFLEKELSAGRLRGLIVIPMNFSSTVAKGLEVASIQVISDGSEPNIAQFVQNYAQGILRVWLRQQAEEQGEILEQNSIQPESRFWYNLELKSKNFLLPGSIAIIMTLIGTLLTALVIAREWERGTMEALMATPIKGSHILLGKLIPYYILAISSMLVCLLVATLWYEVPFKGTFFALFAVTTVFLLAALGQGLVISSFAKDQFFAAQMALITAFLPAYILSGFIFEISAMPYPIQIITYGFAVRYFVSTLQTLFLVGNVWPLLLTCMASMGFIGCLMFIIASYKTVKRLD